MNRNKKVARRIQALLSCVAAGTTAPALGGSYYFTNAAGGSWATTTNWTSSIIPGSAAGGTGDYAYLGTSTSTSPATVTLNYAYNAASNSTTSSTSYLMLLSVDGSSATQNINLVQSSATSAMYCYFESIGDGSQTGNVATYTQSNGTNSTTGVFNVGNSSPGNYSISGGSLTMALLGYTIPDYVGYESTGTFTQTGGTVTYSGPAGATSSVNGRNGYGLYLGWYGGVSGSSGTYTLSNSSFNANLIVNASEYIGAGYAISGAGSQPGTGVFNQTGFCTNTVTNNLTLGDALNGVGTYNFSSLLNVGGNEQIGNAGQGTFNQTGGTNTITGSLIVGVLSGSTGTFNLNGGGVINISGNETVGNSGQGLFNQSGGTHTVTGTLSVAAFPGSTGSYNLSAGSLSAGAEQFGVTETVTAGVPSFALGGTASFLQSGGTNTITGSGTLGSAFFIWNNTTYTLSGGTLNLPATIGSAQNNGTFIISNNGTETGTLVNTNQFTSTGGTFNGRLINQGTVSLGTLFTAGNGIENDSYIYINSSQIVQVNGLGLDNVGTLYLSGGTISGSGPVLNDVGGQLSGYGTIYSAFTNDGTLTVGGSLRLLSATTPVNAGIITGSGTITGGLNNTGTLSITAGNQLAITAAWTNNGLVTMQGTGAVLNGGAITNNRTIQGSGTINSAINNSTGVIRASGGELDLGGTITNGVAGQIESATGTTVVAINGLTTNAGTIALGGGTFDNNNLPMNVTGTIEGNGTLRTGGLTIASGADLLLTDSPSSVYGAVTNSTGGYIKIVSNTTTFYGAVTNNGTIKVTSGVARFLGNGVSLTVGSNYTSDPSDNYFSGLAVQPGGTVSGGSGDRFFLTSNSNLTNAGTWSNTGTLSANTVVNTGNFTQTGTLVETGNFTNSGSAVIGGIQNWSAGTVFTNTAGTASFTSDSGSAAAVLQVNVSTGLVNFAATQHLAGLNISTGATVTVTGAVPRSVVVTPVLTDAGTLDLTTNALDVVSGNLATINALVRTGFNSAGTNWSGTGITSSTAAGDTAHLTAVGVIQNNQSGSAIYSGAHLFDGVASGANDILAKFTYYGDTDLNGQVDGTDYSRVDVAFIADLNNPSAITGWFNGDFNYDGTVNGSDYTLMDNAFNRQGAPLSAQVASPTSQIARAPSVPEPGSTMLLLAGAVTLLGRRRGSR